MSLTYPEALAEIQGRGRFGVRLGLGRTHAILREMGDPHVRFRGALVAGTNGKGSVLALMGAALREAGLRAGETPKPHLVTYRERLRIGGRLVDARTFARLVEEALPIVDRVARRLGEPTEFEVLTTLAYRWFADERVDLASIEVGLGGRLDATHAWDGGVAVIVNVDLDHTAWLGPTVEAIAREKAAIIVRGDRAVTGATGPALDVIRRRARRVGADLTIVDAAPLRGIDRDGIVVDLPRLGETRVGLRGRHQAANVAVADAALDALEAAGIARVGADARRRGYAAARWPGRLELVTAPATLPVSATGASGGPASAPAPAASGGPASAPASAAAGGPASAPAASGGPASAPAAAGGRVRDVLLDGAHNPAGAAALATALDDLRPFLAGWHPRHPAQATLVTASMGDKDVPGVVTALAAAPALAGARVICTSLPEARALPAADLAAAWRTAAPGAAVATVDDPQAALSAALASGEGPVIVAGSLYLVGALRAWLVDDPELADPDDPAVSPGVRGWAP